MRLDMSARGLIGPRREWASIPKQQDHPHPSDPRHKPIPPVAGVKTDGEASEDGAEGLDHSSVSTRPHIAEEQLPFRAVDLLQRHVAWRC